MDNLNISGKDFESLLERLAEKHREAIDEKIDAKHSKVLDILQKQGAAITAMKETPGRSDSLNDIFRTKNFKLDPILNGSARSVKLELSPMEVKALVTRDSVTDSTLANRISGVGQVNTTRTVMRSLFNTAQVSANSNGVLRYFDQVAEGLTRGADTRSEGAEKPESAITWVEKMLKIEKIADTIPVSMEALNDVSFIEGEIRRLLSTNLQLKEDEQLYNGDGLSPNLQGVYDVAPEFTAYSGPAIDFPNFFDLVAAMKATISNGNVKYNPNVVLVNPIDAIAFRLVKGADEHYLLPSIVGGGNSVFGVQIVESGQVEQGTLLMGDFSYGTIYDLQGATIDIGWVNDQFITNQMTIRAEKRLGLLIREVDEDAFLKVTDITSAIALLEAGS
jgi:HK97 family phage major capsid protein